jgi:hypothetical protein
VVDDDEHTGFAEIDIFGHQRSDLFGSSDLIGYFLVSRAYMSVVFLDPGQMLFRPCDPSLPVPRRSSSLTGSAHDNTISSRCKGAFMVSITCDDHNG